LLWSILCQKIKKLTDSSILPARIACGEALAGGWVEQRIYKSLTEKYFVQARGLNGQMIYIKIFLITL